MDIPSVLFSFWEATLKRWSTGTIAEIEQIMSAKLQTHLAVHDGCQKLFKIFENFKNYFWVLFI